MDMKASQIANTSLTLMDKHLEWSAYLRPDPYALSVNVLGATQALSGLERFGIVSSLYGSGSLACWFLVLASLLVSWTINPAFAKKDSISNDFIAVLSIPIIAAAHFFHQVYRQVGSDHDKRTGLHDLFTNLDRDNVRIVAAIEAPLTVCENFIVWGAVLFFIAARKGHQKRMFGLVAVMSLCLSVECFLLSDWVPFKTSLLLRPFFFHLIPFLGLQICWSLLTYLFSLLELLIDVLSSRAKTTSQAEIESGGTLPRRVLTIGQFSSWMAACSALVAGIGMLWIKYLWIYPWSSSNSVRLLPRSAIGVWDLDQVVTAVGGAVALIFSLRDAYRERKRARIELLQETS